MRWTLGKRRSRLAGQDRSRLSDALSIHLRELDNDYRILSGYWEGNFIKDALNPSSVGVLVKRTSRLVILMKMTDATAGSALAGIASKLNAILTYNHGGEMARHAELSEQIPVKGYFCDPHSP